MLGEERVDLVREPGLAPEFEGALHTRRKDGEEVRQAAGVAAEVGRKLEEERAELPPEPANGRAELAGHLGSIAESTPSGRVILCP